jgi:hypothetical protein
LELPTEPTIYDSLVLALRPKDLIASFNWDPFLTQAFLRNNQITELPNCAFLHGNVSIGYSAEDGRAGPAGARHRVTGNYYAPTPLLFPVTQKNYNHDPFIKQEWVIRLFPFRLFSSVFKVLLSNFINRIEVSQLSQI